MPIETTCPGCQSRYRLADNSAGMTVRCQKCEREFPVPAVPLEAVQAAVKEGPPGKPPRSGGPPARQKPLTSDPSSGGGWMVAAVVLILVSIVGMFGCAGVVVVVLVTLSLKEGAVAEPRGAHAIRFPDPDEDEGFAKDRDPWLNKDGAKEKPPWFDRDHGAKTKEPEKTATTKEPKFEVVNPAPQNPVDRALIKNVMKKAMVQGLTKKVSTGKAAADENEQLISLFADLASIKSPTGKDQDWQIRTGALLAAAKAGDGEALKKAADCAGCHREHKGR